MRVIYAYSIVLSLMILFRQSFVSVAVSVHCTDVKGKSFRAEYALEEEDSARNGTAA